MGCQLICVAIIPRLSICTSIPIQCDPKVVVKEKLLVEVLDLVLDRNGWLPNT